MRRTLLALLRATHLIEFADRFAAQRAVSAAAARNARYRAAHPSRAFPPAALVYEVAAHADLESYDRSGAEDAARIAAILRDAGVGEDARILDWGCGPGRVLARLPALMPRARFSACDADRRAVEAAKATLCGVEITQSGAAPPAPYADASFDAIYAVSVLTHLPPDAAEQWIAELARLVSDDGVVVLTTHGRRAAARLEGAERARFDAGEYVTLTGARSGRRTFAAYVNEAAARSMFARCFADVRLQAAPDGRFIQDIWVLRRPRRTLDLGRDGAHLP